MHRHKGAPKAREPSDVHFSRRYTVLSVYMLRVVLELVHVCMMR